MDEMTLLIAEDDFYSLPAEARELIRVYGGARCRVLPGDVLAFVIARGRWPEIRAAAGTLSGALGDFPPTQRGVIERA